MESARRTACPDPGVLDRFARGTLEADDRARTEAHLDGCAECMRVVCELAAAASVIADADTHAPAPASQDSTMAARAAGPSDSPPAAVDPLSATGASAEPPRAVLRSARGATLEIGASIGRYVVVDFLGAGGMGAVYAAYDPELDRKVALKVLLHDVRSDGEQRKRLIREAQALARLQHPNVVAVHDVGVHDGRVFVAMEFVRGKTLNRWLATKPDIQARIRAFVQAGRGLAAAHAHGLVHRDFKPDNVMVDAADRVRVMDFGLARATEAMVTQTDETPSLSDEPSMLEAELSATGTIAGTPAYMSPEQYAGKDVDARSDQFSFCVTLYEAFAGVRPFAGGSLAELATNICKGRIDDSVALPAHIRRITSRGLQTDPRDRWPSMDALLDALDRDPARRRKTALGLVGGATAIAGALAWGRVAGDRTCDGGEEAVAAIWSAPQREALEGSFRATELPYADTARTQVTARLDAFASEFAAAHRATCEATELRHEQSAALMDARMQCLGTRLQDFSATVELLEHADASLVERATDLVLALPELAPCEDADYVTAKVPPPETPELLAQTNALRDTLARVRARRHAGQLTAARELLAGADPNGVASRYAPVGLELELETSAIAGELDDPAAAVTGYENVFFAARTLGLDALRMEAAIELVYLHGYDLAQPELGLQWARHASAEVDAVGTPADRSHLLAYMGSVNRRAGDTATALTLLQESLAIDEVELGPDHLQVSQTHNNLCTLLKTRGDHERAESHCRRALDIRRANLGEDHPRIAETLNNLGSIAYARENLDAALDSFQRSAEIVGKSLGRDRPAYARALNNIGAIHNARGEPAKAAEHYERARQIWSAALGPRHPDVAMALHNLGTVAPTPQEQRAYYEQALAIREEAGGPDHLDVAETLNNLGQSLQRLGDQAGALEKFRRSLDILERKSAPDNPRIGMSHFAVGAALIELGRREEAVGAYERALDTADKAPPSFQAQLKFALARALPAKERQRALALAQEAASALGDAEGSSELRASIERWRAEAQNPRAARSNARLR